MTDVVATHRKLDAAFLDALEALAAAPAPNWWQDVLRSDDLFIAVRRNSLNAYYRGASIFKIDWIKECVVPSTHIKYLVRQAQTYVPLIDGRFQNPAASSMRESYEGPETLRQMMRAATSFAGPEKSGLHPLLVGDPAIIDAEIALTRAVTDEATTQQHDRLDAAVIRNTKTGPEVVFCEAKHFTNGALRATGDGLPAVIGQINDYENALTRYADALKDGYVEVAKALVRLNAMKKLVRNGDAPKLHDAILSIAQSNIPPLINAKPYLLIFGFDKAQRDDEAWVTHLQKLKDHLDGRVRAIGNPTRQSVAIR
ncbi:hypothetical protein GB928_014115 [Shinella curvata]|uniref:Restriction endonuclease n=1 Tax=Shinella curvata TaxID=1817964 RepID=A0ABT8XEZ9_9HYPH|nr:hypothetical protein [Shinella curvata]MCJ8052993.1 hypothetical protein [Shinella curvata]MDO6122324.1 hypothetical protein [Shinella curvata]